jgi:hypothetical protein
MYLHQQVKYISELSAVTGLSKFSFTSTNGLQFDFKAPNILARFLVPPISLQTWDPSKQQTHPMPSCRALPLEQTLSLTSSPQKGTFTTSNPVIAGQTISAHAPIPWRKAGTQLRNRPQAKDLPETHLLSTLALENEVPRQLRSGVDFPGASPCVVQLEPVRVWSPHFHLDNGPKACSFLFPSTKASAQKSSSFSNIAAEVPCTSNYKTSSMKAWHSKKLTPCPCKQQSCQRVQTATTQGNGKWLSLASLSALGQSNNVIHP